MFLEEVPRAVLPWEDRRRSRDSAGRSKIHPADFDRGRRNWDQILPLF